MMSKIIYVVLLTSIIGCIGSEIEIGQPTNLGQDGTYFDLYKRLEVLENLRAKDAWESIAIRKTVEIQKYSLDQALDDLSALKDEFGKLQSENKLLHARLDIAMLRNMEMSEKCEQKCSASEKGTFRESGNTPKSDLDIVHENGIKLQGDSRETEPKLATKEFIDPNAGNTLQGIRNLTGRKRVAESDPLAGGRGFFARTTQTISSLANGHVIVFNSVVTNTHSDYSGLTGAFTCGTPGLYVFSWTIHINIHWLRSDLLKNGKAVAQAYSGDDQAYNTTGTNVAVLFLDRGDVITVNVKSRNPITSILPYVTNFSGYLVV